MTGDQIRALTPIAIAFLAVAFGVCCLFTPYGKEGIAVVGGGFAGAFGLSQARNQ
jgi:hypothetical protein